MFSDTQLSHLLRGRAQRPAHTLLPLESEIFRRKLLLADLCCFIRQVLLIFSDGLDEDVMKLEEESERLRLSGKCVSVCACVCELL